MSEKKANTEADDEAPEVDSVPAGSVSLGKDADGGVATADVEPDTGDSVNTTDDVADSPATPRRPRNRKVIALVAAGILAVILFALAAFQYWGPGSDDRAVDSNQSAAAKFAGDSAIKILSYKHGTVDQDVATATGLLTGDFLDYYKNFTSTVVIPAAKKEEVDTQATIAGTSVERASSDGATVLVFVNQSTTTAANDTPTLSASSVRVVVKRVDGQLRVEKFDPV